MRVPLNGHCLVSVLEYRNEGQANLETISRSAGDTQMGSKAMHSSGMATVKGKIV